MSENLIGRIVRIKSGLCDLGQFCGIVGTITKQYRDILNKPITEYEITATATQFAASINFDAAPFAHKQTYRRFGAAPYEFTLLD